MNHAAGFVPVKPGDILAEKHRVERVLGTGAMGVVVAATHVELHETRAIKFMLPSALGDAEGVERFLMLWRRLARHYADRDPEKILFGSGPHAVTDSSAIAREETPSSSATAIVVQQRSTETAVLRLSMS